MSFPEPSQVKDGILDRGRMLRRWRRGLTEERCEQVQVGYVHMSRRFVDDAAIWPAVNDARHVVWSLLLLDPAPAREAVLRASSVTYRYRLDHNEWQ